MTNAVLNRKCLTDTQREALICCIYKKGDSRHNKLETYITTKHILQNHYKNNHKQNCGHPTTLNQQIPNSMRTTKTDTYEPLVHQRHHKNSQHRTHVKHSNHIYRPNKSFRPSRLELSLQNTGQIQIRKQNGPKHSNAIHKHHDKN